MTSYKIIKSINLILIIYLVMISSACNNTQSPQDTSSKKIKTALQFTDVTLQAGLGKFHYNNGAQGKKWLPETMGAGVAFLDYDQDGWLDILIVAGATLNTKNNIQALQLYRNTQDNHFEKQTHQAGLSNIRAYGFGISVADYDNDGDADFYLTTLQHNLLFRNDNGIFKQIASSANVSGDKVWSTAATFIDVNQDSWLDLFVGNYIKWSVESDLWCSITGKSKAYCTPESYPGLTAKFYLNRGDGRFDEKSSMLNLDHLPGKTLGVVALDYNNDNWMDLVVANDTERNLLFKNNGPAGIKEVGQSSGIAYDENGKARAGMGIDAGVVDDTQKTSIFIGNFSKEMIGVYRYQDNDLFIDRAISSKVGIASLSTLTFAVLLADFDLDGDLDLFTANGHVQTENRDGTSYQQTPHLFINRGKGQFVDMSTVIGGSLAAPMVARGAAYGDYDRDGDLDLILTDNRGPVKLLRNDLPKHFNYLRIQLQSKTSNRDAIGAKVHVKLGNKIMFREVKINSGYLSSSERTLTFGLNRATQADSIVVTWPNGQTSKFETVASQQEILIIEGETHYRTLAR
ncbi:ASPIC/UnbV domain protein [hydrothermal vent metagenome]|uniref:ASPIC/UnbV domain protein n=1 Tax=hydrothermal vent metagenome TaxID=652676 RepID=A0A3B1AW97_9ZZZZ